MNPSQPGQPLSSVKRALIEIRELRARVAELEADLHEPIAIVGLAIRAPGGVHDAESFAKLLWQGVDAITSIPAGRWDRDAWFSDDPERPGRMYSEAGGFIDEVDGFDAEFFGISPLEAASMDPQQRLLLELAWQALEDAGHSPAALSGSSAGVYIGIANGDYGRALFAQPELIDPYFSPGNAYSVASGRIAYLLGTHGPAISVDTACSSSLVALHLACQGLRRRECNLALAGGVNLILGPELHVNFCKAGMMSRSGRCKTFDATADGYVRGEGGAVVVLRRLREALADGDRVLSVIRGSAVNQDGRSNGLTAPNGPAQEAVLRSALANAGVAARTVGYVEAHGTGTSLGDPIEVNALGDVYGSARDADRPLVIGSVKTNIGHLEAAAGIAGIVKTVLALQRHEIPPHLHLSTPNPHIRWDSLPIAVAGASLPWQPIDGCRRAGVSSFGFSGTNAHVILEEAPPQAPHPDQAPEARTTHLLALSARDEAALRMQVANFRKTLDGVASEDRARWLPDACFTANTGRAHFQRRLSVQGRDASELDAALSAWQAGELHPGLISANDAGLHSGRLPPRVAFLFPGQGTQYAGMGRELYRSAPAFRAAFDKCADALDSLLDRPIRPLVLECDGDGALDETAYSQPAVFAISYALAGLWRSWGVEPVAVMGHSFGEYAAACVAGALSLDDAARMVVARGRLAQSLPADGAMCVIEAHEQQVLEAIAGYQNRISVAAINGALNTVVSGERRLVADLAATFSAKGARVKPLKVSRAFHSPLMDPVLEAFEAQLSKVAFMQPRVALVSSLSGQLVDLSTIGSSTYWRRHMREPVRFADAIRTLAAQGVTHCIEMSAAPVLLGMGAELVAGASWLPSLREGDDDWQVILASLQQLYCDGADIDWRGLDVGQRRSRIALPTYPFQRRRHWIAAAQGRAAAAPLSSDRWAGVVREMDREAARGPLDLDVASYPDKWDCLSRLTLAHATRTLRDLGVFKSRGERHGLDRVLEVTEIGATYRHLVDRWLRALASRGMLREEAGEFIADEPLAAPDMEVLWAEAGERLSDNRPLLDYVRHCGSLVTEVLRGRESPLETLFPGGSFDLAQALYEESATMRYVNQLACAAFRALGDATPAGRVLRVLEVGGGTGGTTASLLAALPADRARYRFSDVSDIFLVRARERFGAHAWVDYGLFDLERPPQAQGYAGSSYDVIVAANAVHAVRDLRAALARLLELLSPGGVLVLVESTVHLDYFDMTTGLIEGWQHFADDLRTDNPLLAPQAWTSALLQAGFVDARAWPETGSPAAAMGQHLVLARAPGAEAATGLGGRDADSKPATADDRLTAMQTPLPIEDAWGLRLRQAGQSERLDLLREMVRAQIMTILRLSPDSPPSRRDRLMDLGMDSLMAVRLRNTLTQALQLGQPLPSTLIFSYPTIDAIAGYLHALLQQAAAPPSSPFASPSLKDAEDLDSDAADVPSDEEIVRLLDERMGSL